MVWLAGRREETERAVPASSRDPSLDYVHDFVHLEVGKTVRVEWEREGQRHERQVTRHAFGLQTEGGGGAGRGGITGAVLRGAGGGGGGPRTPPPAPPGDCFQIGNWLGPRPPAKSVAESRANFAREHGAQLPGDPPVARNTAAGLGAYRSETIEALCDFVRRAEQARRVGSIDAWEIGRKRTEYRALIVIHGRPIESRGESLPTTLATLVERLRTLRPH
jgi:hypothetical protein